MGKKETYITRRIVDNLAQLNEGFFFKVHAAGYHQSGISDILGCHFSKFYALEVKTPERRNEVTPTQDHFQKRVRAAGGTAEIVTCWDEVKEIILL